MPIKVTPHGTSEAVYDSPFVHTPEEQLSIRLDVSALDGSDWLDDNGVLIPGFPVKYDGTLATPIDAAGQEAYGVLAFPVRLVGPHEALADLSDHDLAFATSGTFNRQAVEDQLGRDLTADEVAAIQAARNLTMVE